MESRKEATRDRILIAAEGLFRRFTFPGLRMKHISESTGVSRKTLYNHFPGGKREIWKRCVERRTEGFYLRILGLMEDTGRDFVERGREVLGIGREAMALFYGPGGLIPSSSDEEFFFPDLRKQYVQVLTSFFEEGVTLGYLREGLPLRTLSASLMALITEWGRTESLLREGESANLPEFVEAVLFDGILSDEGRRQVPKLHRGDDE